MKVEIRDEIVEKLRKRVNNTDEFNSVEDYITHILEQVANRLETETTTDNSLEVNENTKKKEIAKRLKSLGY